MIDSESALIGVTGATGELGSRVARRLAACGRAPRLIVRDPARAPHISGAPIVVAGDYLERAALTAALRGVHTLLLVSGREAANRVAQHRSAVDAAIEGGVRRIVYTSFLGAAEDATFTFARDHFATEQYIRGTPAAYTFLRNSMYLEYAPLFASPAGVIAGPAGDGRVAWVSRDDAADVASTVLQNAGHAGRTYDVTGPRAETLANVAAELTRVCGRLVTYTSETLDEAYASRASFGAPPFEVAGWVTSYAAMATGEMDVVSDTVPALTGHRAQNLPDFLAAHPESYAHLRAPK